MGVFRTRRGRLRAWVYVAAALVVLPVGALAAAAIAYPERFAREDACVAASGQAIVNECSAAVMAEACVAGDDGIRRCALLEIAPGQSVARPRSIAQGELELAACRAPYVPALVDAPIEMEFLTHGCRTAQ